MTDNMLKKIIKKILEIITPDKIILFGSQATGKAGNESDYDLLIVISGITNKRELSKKLYRNMFGTKARVDIIVEVPEVIEKHKDSAGYIYKQILREGKVVYAK
jgi:predicted nucleotidyltransferase